MSVEITMPRLSDSMEEGTIVRWLKSEGDEVARGDELVEIETDKATMVYETDVEGVLEIIASTGDTLPVGEVIARVNGAGSGQAGAGAPRRAADLPVGALPRTPARPGAAGSPAPDGAPATSVPRADGGRVKASPLARRLAGERGIDLHALSGTGPGGRIVRADVEAAGAAAPTPAAPAAPDAAKGEVTTQEPIRAQALIARRMAESRASIPDFTISTEVRADAALALRAELKAVLNPPPSLNDMVVKACALSLREHPRVNGSYRDGHFESYSRFNVGIVVAAEDALTVATVFDADTKPLAQVAAEARALAERVRTRTITPAELSGGTFTVSNLGMFGIVRFQAVINPPQAAILAVGAALPRPAVRDGALVEERVIELTLSCDHRILYGADAARFLSRVQELLEQPLSLLVQ
jgi:pyruvate dehydrogenase E2 component (dihydrolipoamide acetyltransferase)